MIEIEKKVFPSSELKFKHLAFIQCQERLGTEEA